MTILDATRADHPDHHASFRYHQMLLIQITCQTVFPLCPPGNWLDVGLLRGLPVPQHIAGGLPLLSAFALAVVAAGVIPVLAGASKVRTCSRLGFAGSADDR